MSGTLAFFLIFQSTAGYAQSAFVTTLPEPGQMLGTSPAFTPILVKGLVVHPDKPLDFDFIVDSGTDSSDQTNIREQSQRMARYFLAAITVPEDQIWVNLSPVEKDRVIERELGQTFLGRDMLAQDYVLKQFTASLLYPEKGLGKEFWSRIYKEAQEKFGTANLPVDAFNKVWIVPQRAVVFETDNAVYITEAKLKVLLDSDRTAGSQERIPLDGSMEPQERGQSDKALFVKEVLRRIILPEIEQEVNSGKNFATLRQVFYAAILATWYRKRVKDTLMSSVYVGKNRISGVNTDDKTLKEQIYQRYIAAYKKGVFNLIKEQPDATTAENVPHKYFSGGLADFGHITLTRTDGSSTAAPVGDLFDVDMGMKPEDHSSVPDSGWSGGGGTVSWDSAPERVAMDRAAATLDQEVEWAKRHPMLTAGFTLEEFDAAMTGKKLLGVGLYIVFLALWGFSMKYIFYLDSMDLGLLMYFGSVIFALLSMDLMQTESILFSNKGNDESPEKEEDWAQTQRQADPLQARDGGIDINDINVVTAGKGQETPFNEDILRNAVQGDFKGFRPEVLNITQISSHSVQP